MYCTRLAENTGSKNDAKIRRLRTIPQHTLSGHIFATKAHIDISEKFVKPQLSSPHVRTKFAVLEQTQGLHLQAKFHLNLFIVSPSGGQKPQFCAKFDIFGSSCTDPLLPMRAKFGEIQDAKIANNSPSGHRRTTLSGYIIATKACIDNRKNLLNSNISSIMLSQYDELRPIAG